MAKRSNDNDNVRQLQPKAVRSTTARGGARAQALTPEVRSAREAVALDMYLKGATYPAIAVALGVAQSSVVKFIREGLAKRSDPELAAKAREIMGARLELMLARWMPLALGTDEVPPDKDAAETTLKILDRLGMIHGTSLLPPVQQTVVVTVESMRREILRSLEETAERAELVAGTLEREDPPA